METKDKIILVTGATGHQGNAVTRYLLKDGWKVRALTRHPQSPEALKLKESGVEINQVLERYLERFFNLRYI